MHKYKAALQKSWPTVNKELTKSWDHALVALCVTPACLYPTNTSVSIGIAMAIVIMGYAPSIKKIGKLKSAFQDYTTQSIADLSEQMTETGLLNIEREELQEIPYIFQALTNTNQKIQDIKLSAENLAAATVVTIGFAVEENVFGIYENLHEAAMTSPLTQNIVPDFNTTQKYLTAFLAVTLWMHLKGIGESKRDIAAAYNEDKLLPLDTLEPPEQ